MLNFQDIIKNISENDVRSSDFLYNPESESLNYEEISKDIDEFDTSPFDYLENPLKTPIKKKRNISASPFIDNLSENYIRNNVYKTPTQYKTPKTNRKTRSISKTVEKGESPNFGVVEVEAKKDNFDKETTKFKCFISI